jgi:crotonobetaine/carnitine-CoA ligase
VKTFKEMLSKSAERWGDRTFIRYDDDEITFREFDQTTDRAAHFLFQHGIRKGDKILLFLPNCLEFIYAWCGASKIGAVVVPTNFNLKPDELQYNVNHSGSRAIITKEPFAEVVQKIKEQCPNVTHYFLAEDHAMDGFLPFRFDITIPPLPVPDIHISPDDLLVILYTSGTTGRPKGVMHSNASYLLCINTWANEVLQDGDATMSVLPMFHVSGHLYTIFSHLAAGEKVVITKRFSASQFWSLAKTCQINYMTMPLPLLLILLAQPASPMDRDHSVKKFISSCSPQVAEEFEKRFGVEIYSSYGLSEDPLMFLGAPVTEEVKLKRSHPPHGGALLGKPLSPEKHKVKITDDEYRELPPGCRGRILNKGPSISGRARTNRAGRQCDNPPLLPLAPSP